MCYLVREHEAAASPGTPASPPRDLRLRPRWAGALAAAVIGAFAFAALVAPSPTSKLADAHPAGMPIAAARAATDPGTGGLERTTLPMDDGVPSTGNDNVQPVAGGCHHGL